MKNTWSKVDDYFGDLLAPADDALKAALHANDTAKLPAIGVSRLQGKFLHLLVKITQAKKVLEIGTLGGYSTIWMARALPWNGSLVTLEADPHHAATARGNLVRAGLDNRVSLRLGRALVPCLRECVMEFPARLFASEIPLNGGAVAVET
ncbi:MAG TPA: class I SAM-dependent methyltransferase [Terracidiphilus sp.]|nr:class I SAM-dependent methyltransferase [Terracidiphilus sp.]